VISFVFTQMRRLRVVYMVTNYGHSYEESRRRLYDQSYEQRIRRL
jgi:hypothetical protein